ncbi:MAG: hypothetical protein LAQ69_31255 [Acidobacteriia bacterium]|nr:hypothetical protein [Terriglobia bacterium]
MRLTILFFCAAVMGAQFIGVSGHRTRTTGAPLDALAITSGAGTTLVNTGSAPFSWRGIYGAFLGPNKTVTALCRWKVAGNIQTHLVELVANTGYVILASASVDLTTCASGTWCCASIAPVTVIGYGGATYFVLSHETDGGDQWYDVFPVTSDSGFQAEYAAYGDNTSFGQYATGKIVVPVNLRYH